MDRMQERDKLMDGICTINVCDLDGYSCSAYYIKNLNEFRNMYRWFRYEDKQDLYNIDYLFKGENWYICRIIDGGDYQDEYRIDCLSDYQEGIDKFLNQFGIDTKYIKQKEYLCQRHL